jgi:hypothetical protein
MMIFSKTHHENPQARSSLASTSQKMYLHNSLWEKVGYSSQNSGYHETSNMSLESSEFPVSSPKKGNTQLTH